METTTRVRVLSLAAGAVGAAIVFGLAGGTGGPDKAQALSLEPFSSCDELLEYARDHRWARNPGYAPEGDLMFAQAEGAAESLPAQAVAADSGAVGPGQTGTNVQEAGIDEPDIAKVSGTTLFRIDGNTLSSYDVSGADAEPLDELELSLVGGKDPVDPFLGSNSASELLISDDKAIVIAPRFGRGGESTQVVEVDIADPGAMAATRSLELEGAEVSARLQGDTARLVIESQPDYPGVESGSPVPQPRQPEDAPTGATGETGPEAADDEPEWMPQATLTDLETGERSAAPIAGCGDVAFPDEFSGLGLLSVLTMDVSEGIAPTNADVVMADGSTVYASASSLYVATQEMIPPRGGVVESIGSLIQPDDRTVPIQPSGDTQIHRFDSGADATEYVASGEVPGRLIGQFAMSESNGLLRVASTVGDTWTEGPSESESMITVLAADDGALDEIGRVDGLGRGEEIYAVRFIGEMAYVVTFEQTDPLYTVDLTDPESPQTTGELKVPGYSAYLHPVGGGLLLGIGQDGTQAGAITGAQASLFDVGNPKQPDRLDTLDLAQGRYGSASAEWDHHAFLYSPEHALAVVPVESYGRGSQRSATAFRVEPEGELSLVARLEDGGQIERTLVVEDNLVTVSAGGIEVRPIAEL